MKSLQQKTLAMASVSSCERIQPLFVLTNHNSIGCSYTVSILNRQLVLVCYYLLFTCTVWLEVHLVYLVVAISYDIASIIVCRSLV